MGAVSDPTFMGVPESWLDDPTWRCANGHVSKTYLKSEALGGAVCLSCYEPVSLVAPDTVEGVTFSSRGFKQMDPITTTRHETVRVYESSAAEEPHVWLNVEIGPESPYTNEEPGKSHAHMTLAQAEQLRDQLDYLIHNHYQVESPTGPPTKTEIAAARERLSPYLKGYPEPMIDTRRMRIGNGVASERDKREIAAEDVVWREEIKKRG